MWSSWFVENASLSQTGNVGFAWNFMLVTQTETQHFYTLFQTQKKAKNLSPCSWTWHDIWDYTPPSHFELSCYGNNHNYYIYLQLVLWLSATPQLYVRYQSWNNITQAHFTPNYRLSGSISKVSVKNQAQLWPPRARKKDCDHWSSGQVSLLFSLCHF